MVEAAAYVFVTMVGVIVAFQTALACGAPWGQLAMGGKYPGVLPTSIRFAAVLQSVILATLAALVLARAEIAFASLANYAHTGAWVATGFSVIALLLNLATPSKWERALWAPVALLMLVSAFVVARNAL